MHDTMKKPRDKTSAVERTRSSSVTDETNR